MIKSLLAVFIFLIVFNNSYAQEKLAGKVSYADQPIEGINVFLLSVKDSTLLKSTITDVSGSFYFDDLTPLKYLVLFQNIGFLTKYVGPVTITSSSKEVNIGTITIIKTDKSLKEIRVVANKPYIERKIGKTVINLENSVFGLGSTGFEIFETLPGMSIRNDEISLKGQSNVAVFIDDKPSNLSGPNLVDYLKNLQTNNIEKIEIIDGNSSKYDAAYRGGIINIKFKKGKNVGTNGAFSFGAGLGINYRYNTGININKRTKNSNFYINYDYAKIKALDQTFLNRARIYPFMSKAGSNVLFNITNNDTKTKNNQNIVLGYDHQLDKNQSVSVLLNAFSNVFFSDEFNKSLISSNDQLDSTVNSISLENRSIKNLSGSFAFKKELNEKGKALNAEVDFLTFSRKSDENLRSSYLNQTGSEYKPPLVFNNLTPSKINILSGKIDYSAPFGKSASSALGAKISHVKTSNNRLINIISGSGYALNPSILFDYQESILAGYYNYDYKKEKNSLSVGLRLEETFAQGDTSSKNDLINRNYFSLFPNLSYARELDKKNKLSISYDKGIVRPRYDQLNPFSYYLDQYTYNQGNPQLRPCYVNSAKIEWEHNSKYLVSLFYNYTNNFTFIVYQQNPNSNIATTSNQNFDYRQAIGLSVGFPISIAKWYDVDLSAEANKEYFKYTDGFKKEIYNSGFNGAITLNHTLQLPRAVKASINMVYETPTAYAVYRFKPLYFINMGFSKPVLNKSGSLRLVITDLFNTNSNRYASNLVGLSVAAEDKSETQSVRLSFSYKFGKKTVKAFQKRESGADEEKARAIQ
ncbi:TonB-dependent receptor [Pedobacter sp. SD-b]|uniref:TonB-dependent receptor n=1 Tax=Pedobacter segetis TaxID=2793069 RepID=A0ABS1BF08_9SPHI|nr:outer membrane beta-barrel protein [Pedobacter segetis]MBK0381457.1 TonB-dependent receptor [Pedobacter segetis]